MVGRRSLRRVAAVRLVPIVLATLLLGCEERVAPTPPAMTPPPRDPRIKLDTPTDAVRSFFLLLKDNLDALAVGDRAAASRWCDQIAWYVVDRDAIAARVEAALDGRMPPTPVAIADYVENWAAMLNYYKDELDVDDAQVAIEGDRSVLRIHLTGQGRKAWLAVGCLRDSAGTWHVSEIIFTSPPAATAPATAPTQPGTTAP